MIVGDPFNFAFAWDVVDEWNEKETYWKNGIFTIYVGGTRFPEKLEVSELKTSLGTYINLNFSGFNKSKFFLLDYSQRISAMKRHLRQASTDEDKDLLKNESIIDLTCSVLEDLHCWIYLVKISENEESVMILTETEKVSEHVFPLGTVQHIVEQLPEKIL